MVKTDPKSVGVGQYQHDVDQRRLKRSLAATVESSVNRVGVELNSASVDLLKYVSGIGDKLAQNVVSYRDQHGLFRSRMQLREIEGFGDKTFEQAAGFLRINNGDNGLTFFEGKVSFVTLCGFVRDFASSRRAAKPICKNCSILSGF